MLRRAMRFVRRITDPAARPAPLIRTRLTIKHCLRSIFSSTYLGIFSHYTHAVAILLQIQSPYFHFFGFVLKLRRISNLLGAKFAVKCVGKRMFCATSVLLTKESERRDPESGRRVRDSVVETVAAHDRSASAIESGPVPCLGGSTPDRGSQGGRYSAEHRPRRLQTRLHGSQTPCIPLAQRRRHRSNPGWAWGSGCSGQRVRSRWSPFPRASDPVP